MYIIGADIGTTTICGVLYNSHTRKTERVTVRNNQFISSGPYSHDRCQNPAEIEETVKEVIDELIEAANGTPIAGLSVTSQMHGILYLDKNGNPLTPYFTWQNQRGLEVIGGQKVEKRVSEVIGQQVFTGYGVVTCQYHIQTGNIPEGVVKMCGIVDFITMRLINSSIPVTDITIAASLGLVDNTTRTINTRVFDIEGLTPDFLPELVDSSTVLGSYRFVPVVLSLADNQTGFMGSLQNIEDSFLLTYGTGSQLSFYEETLVNYDGFEARPFPGKGYLYVVSSLGGGNSYQLMAEFFQDTLRMLNGEEKKDMYALIDTVEMDFSTSEITCVPLFRGERGADHAAASFSGITAENFTPVHMLKALVQGMVWELHRYYCKLPEDVRSQKPHLVGSGNGIRKNRHLRKVVEMMYEKPLHVFEATEESSLGAVVNAGVGVGVFPDYAAGSRQVVNR